MTYKVGPKGQVVLPKEIRTRLGIEPGDEVTVELHEGGALVRRQPRGSALYGMLADTDVDLLAELEAERRRERAREEEKIRRWSR
jgi:AbrB family looped-hinge helix DNA binding protein